MSRSQRNRRSGVVVIGVVVGAMALAGCGAGQITQTTTQVGGVNGGQANVGPIAIRDAQFEYTETENASVYTRGQDAPLKMSIANTSGTEDKLVSASSPVAQSVRISGEAVLTAGRTLVVAGAPAAAASATPRAGASATPSATRPATPTPAATATTAAAATSAAAAPDADTGAAQVVLVGVNQEIRPGLTYPVTMTFQKAGTVTVQVSVANPSTPRSESAAE